MRENFIISARQLYVLAQRGRKGRQQTQPRAPDLSLLLGCVKRSLPRLKIFLSSFPLERKETPRKLGRVPSETFPILFPFLWIETSFICHLSVCSSPSCLPSHFHIPLQYEQTISFIQYALPSESISDNKFYETRK